MTESAPDKFAKWLSTDIHPALRVRGFTKTAFNFHLRRPAGWGVVNFQKSSFGSRLDTLFTINLGVALDRIAVVRGDDPVRKPAQTACQWGCRLGMTIGDHRDIWWAIDKDTDLDELTRDILPLVIEKGLPLLEDRLTESGFLHAMRDNPTIGHVMREPEVVAALSGTPSA